MQPINKHTLFAAVPLVVVATVAGAGRGAAPSPTLPADTLRLPAPVLASPVSVAPALPPPMTLAPSELNEAAIRRAESAVRAQVERGAFPGAAIAVGRAGQTVLERGFGRLAWGERGEVDPAHTVYDLASLTKVVATTTAVMLLVEDGRMELDAPVWRYLPEFRGGSRDRVTVRQLLTHTSGLPAGSGAGSLARIVASPLRAAPGARMVYSDVNMVVLFAAAERTAGEPLPRLLQRRVWEPLGMISTGFAPGAGCEQCAPTGRSGSFRGLVHDPIARRLGGVAGNAGLFSTAHDLGRFAAMLANGGTLDGVRVLKPETVRTFTRRQPGARTRALGWDTRGSAFLHTGFTGTSLWVDPDRGVWTVLLTNRTYASSGRNPLPALRRIVHRWVESSATELPSGYTASRG